MSTALFHHANSAWQPYRLLRFLALGALLLPFLFWPAWSSAQQVSTHPGRGASSETAHQNQEPLSYRRWLAPLEQIDQWPFGAGRYVPLRRDRFEQLIESSDRTHPLHSNREKEFPQRIVLNARLENHQLVDAQGTLFVPESKQESTRSIILSPWELWADGVVLSNGTPLAFSRSGDGELTLTIPAQHKQGSPVEEIEQDESTEIDLEIAEPESLRIHFRWSLRGRMDAQGRLVFDFSLPPCAGIELNLELPAGKTPQCPTGIVLKQDSTGSEASSEESGRDQEAFSRWKIIFGRHTRTSIFITSSIEPETPRLKSAIRQRVVYHLSPKGTEVISRIWFEQSDAVTDSLVLELESPLRPLEVKFGEKAVPWTIVSGTGCTRVHIDLSGLSQGEPRELTLMSLVPTQVDRPWMLPRVRVVDDSVFWKETRCIVFVYPPLMTRDLSCENAVQVTPAATIDMREQERFAFQYFNMDARVQVELNDHVPQIQLNSFSQVQWGLSEITGSMVIDCGLKEGDRYTIEFPLSPHWTIHSVKSIFGDDILSWDVQDTKSGPGPKKSRVLSIQLKRPLRPKESLRFHVLGRYLVSTHWEFRFADLPPLNLPRRKEESHYLAIEWHAPFHPRYLTPDPEPMAIKDILDPKLSRRFVDPPMGSVFPLDSQSQETRFRVERLKPNYSAEIDGTVYMKENEFILSYRLLCRPADSSVDRVYVLISSETVPDPDSWVWSAESDAIRPITVRHIPRTDRDETFEMESYETLRDELLHGELWEIRLPVPQLKPFELTLRSSLTPSDRTVIPVAILPGAGSQSGEIRFTSPLRLNYRIETNRLTALPPGPVPWQSYQEVRAAFRYDPAAELRELTNPPIHLVRVEPENLPPAAWVWNLRLDTQYESEGMVRNTAVFLIENTGKHQLRILLPDGVSNAQVHAVWLNDQRVTWHPETIEKTRPENMAALQKPERQDSVVLTLPEGKRFVSVSLEYSYTDIALPKQRQLNPRYPGADIPILTGNWTAWFPPEFDVSSRFRTANCNRPMESESVPISKALSYFFQNRRNDPVSTAFWEDLLYGRKRQAEAREAAKIFLDWLAMRALTVPGSDEQLPDSTMGPPRGPGENRSGGPIWSEVLAQDQTLQDMLLAMQRNDSSPQRERRRRGQDDSAVRILIDRNALARYGLTPASQVLLGDSFLASRSGEEILNRNGLVLFVSIVNTEDGDEQYTFHITSLLTAALCRYFGSESIGNCVRYLPVGIPTEPDTSEAFSGNGSIGDPHWIPVAQWSRENQPSGLPWSVSSQIVRLASATHDWVAYEIPQGTDASLYIVHRNTYAAYHLLAFLTMLVLTLRRPLSSPVLLVLLLVAFEILARWVAPCHLGVPSGAFLGCLISLAFRLIRVRQPGENHWKPRPQRMMTESRSIHVPLPETPMDPVGSQTVQDASSVIVRLGRQDAIVTETFHHTPPEPLDENVPEMKPDPRDDSDSDAPTPGPTGLGGWLLFFSILAGSLFVSGTLSAAPATNVSVTQTGLEEPQRSIFDLPETHPDWQTVVREPYRVFYPIDASQRVVENIVWIPEEFFLTLHQGASSLTPPDSQHWRIQRSEYQGTMVYHPLTQGLTLTNFRALYEIVVEEENVTIVLPAMPLVQDGATWDSTAIQPTWRLNPEGTSPSGENSLLVFSIENTRPGTHLLELILEPKLVRSDEIKRIVMDIPRLPASTLKLNMPPDAPPVMISDCIGAVTPHSISTPTITAQLGPTGKLALTWSDEPYRNEAGSSEVESLFWLRARLTQVDIRSKFRYRVESGRIRYVDLVTDPNWQLSGQFHCEEHPIDRVETHFDTSGIGSDRQNRTEIVRLFFKTPVSGLLTIRAGFVLKDFSGIGRIRLPRIRPIHTKITKAMLAVSAEPVLELDCPKEGRTLGFEPLWNGAGASALRSASVDDSLQAVTGGSTPIEYDLMQTPDSWTLAIRTKPIRPELLLTRAYRFDYGDQTALFTAELSSGHELFRQSFSVPENFRIESVEARDQNNNPVELRLGRPETILAPTGELRLRRTIFLQKALTGRFRLTILGHFEAKTSEEPTESARKPLPGPEFEQVLLREERIEAYRTPAVLVGIHPNEKRYLRSEVIPVAPKIFADSLHCGAWKSAEPENSESSDRRLPSPEFTLSMNRPTIHGQTALSLELPDSAGDCRVTLNLFLDIRGGEMETFVLNWDRRCENLLSIEPQIPWALEQKNGQSILRLTPRTPVSGRQQMRIRAKMNTSGRTLSTPDISIGQDIYEQYQIESAVILPASSQGRPVLWDLTKLVPMEPDRVEKLQKQIAELGPVSSVSVYGPRAPWEIEETPVVEPVEDPTQERTYLSVTDKGFSARVSVKDSRAVATLYDVNLFVRQNGDLYGWASFDLKPQGQDRFVLDIPDRFELIQLSSTCIGTGGIKRPDGKWDVQLSQSDYPQRVGIVFRGNLIAVREDIRHGADRFQFSLDRIAREKSVTNIQLPLLENVDIEETLWTLFFESPRSGPPPMLALSAVREQSAQEKYAGTPLPKEFVESFGRMVPLTGMEAAQSQLKIDLVRLDHLLFQLDSLPTPGNAKMAEAAKWYAQWTHNWVDIKSMIDFQALHYPAALHSDEHSILLDPIEKRTEGSVATFIESESMKSPDLSLQALLFRKDRATERLGLIEQEELFEEMRRFSTGRLAHFRVHNGGEHASLLGVTGGKLREVRILSLPDTLRWQQRLASRAWIWVILPLLFLILARRFSIGELFVRFPHFWGAVAGLLLWCLSPTGLPGLVVLALVFLSLFRTAWPSVIPADYSGP